ncbi:Mur ligase [Epithele typhae]|uniref:Mur ligase n=1 Tax=Epithele typhae TaxID=378194 RepID=UPI00200758A6|nr:Mur ligase [Epithele typhae]KAH9925421.1 Mur ligase [Epithele typhae]
MSIDLSLDRIVKLFAALPEAYNRPTIHIAGTNGKGSVCAYVSSILSHSGLTVGRFNTPHLLEVIDSICINNRPISPELFAPARQAVLDLDKAHGCNASGFELFTCAVLLIFQRLDVDIVVLEVGMGGRLDATNVVPDDAILVSALTSVDLDHQAFLGTTVEQIAREKVAIARPGKPFVLGPQAHPSVATVARTAVEAAGVPWSPRAGSRPSRGTRHATARRRRARSSRPASPSSSRSLLPRAGPRVAPLRGAHQLDNLATAAGIVAALLAPPSPSPSPSVRALRLAERVTPVAVARGIGATRWPGRLSFHTLTLPADPTPDSIMTTTTARMLVLADGAHNPASAGALAAYLESLAATTVARPLTLTYVLGLSHSPPKTPAQTLAPLLAVRARAGPPIKLGAALLAFTPPQDMPWVKAVPPEDIAAAVAELAPSGDVEVWRDPRDDDGHGRVERALRWAAARGDGTQGDALVVVAGSLYLVADFYRLLEKLGQAGEIWGLN